MKCIISVLILIYSFTSVAQDWELEKDKEGIKVYTRLEPGNDLKSFKGVAYTNASISDIYQILLDAGNVKDWAFSIIESELLEKGKNYFIYYTEFDSPWPVDNRDFVLKADIKESSSEQFRIEHNYIPNKKAEKDGIVRVKKTNLIWSAQKTEKGTKLTYQGYSDPGGTIPTWLANSSVVDSPFYSLKNLMEKAESK
ncbi:MAG: START domain-containing protein [Flavobacteriales bacterium]|nr:START domain-containing protein [Flavobacteriales bacterium]